LRACDRGAPALALAAGIVAGIAAQTKYTALLMPAVIVVYAALCHRLRLGVIAAVVAYSVFAVWETFMTYRYGNSHFLYHLGGHGNSLKQNTSALLSLIMILGGVAPGIMLLGMAALRVRTTLIALAGAGALLGFALLPCINQNLPARLGMPFRLNRDSVVFGLMGCGACSTLILCGRRLCSNREWNGRIDQDAWFLALWLGLEVAGYFILSPFPAVRRVLAVTVVSALLAGRLLSGDCATGTWRTYGIVTAGTLLGLGYYLVDMRDAMAQRSAAERCAACLHVESGGKGWYVGHWGFQYYAERAGLRAVIPNVTRLHRDDWLFVPSAEIAQQKLSLSSDAFQTSAAFWIEASIPYSATSCYYGSRTPLQPLHGPRVWVTAYRIRYDVTPCKPR
jgi:hypothetical protein